MDPQPLRADRIAVPDAGALSDARAALLARTMDLIDGARADSTRRAYASDWRHFEAFCDRLELTSLPADPLDVALYLVHLHETGHASATVARRAAAVADRHTRAGHDSPTTNQKVRQVMTGIRRADPARPAAKRALTVAELRRMVHPGTDDPAVLRDNAVLLTGFLGALRRSELAALQFEDLTLIDDGYRVRVCTSKTDQEGDGRHIALPYTADTGLCPVTAIDAWRSAAGIDSGPLFRRIRRGGHVTADPLTGQSIAAIVKARAAAAGIDPDAIGAHSLRSGFVTLAAARGVPERAIAHQTGHRSMPVLRRYIHTATVFEDNAVTDLGL